jgi:hypothetical protein
VRRLLIAIFLSAAGCHHHDPPSAAQIAAVAAGAPRVGDAAPAASLHDAAGAPVALASLWPAHAQTVVVFYRGFY